MSLFSTRRKLLGAALLAGGLPAVVRAQEFPGKTITVIVPYPAGGPADLIARQMLPTLRKSLGQTVIVDNIAGAGGAVGIQKLLAAPPDGHFLVIGTPSDVVLGPLTLTAVKHRPEQAQRTRDQPASSTTCSARQARARSTRTAASASDRCITWSPRTSPRGRSCA